MKAIKNILFIAGAIFILSSCSSDTTDEETGNNTTSGSYATTDSDSTNLNDTIHPMQNGMDTTGEQTGRMNNPASGNSQPATNDSSKAKK
jgi:hypothetical protein